MSPLEETFKADPESAAAVRGLIRQALPDGPPREDIVLVASEMTTNVIRHARTDFVVRVQTGDDLIRIEVWNGSSIIPAVKDLSRSGFGLRIIEALSYRWGIESIDTGKKVWAEFRPR